MLVISRKAGEAVMIGPDIIVTVVEVRGDKIRLGIDAPDSMDVYREEVLEAIRRNGKRGRKACQDG